MMEHCQVGLFKLPGIKFEKTEIPEDIVNDMNEWCKENNCGMQMNSWLWSFKNDAQRDWFILRWSDTLSKIEK